MSRTRDYAMFAVRLAVGLTILIVAFRFADARGVFRAIVSIEPVRLWLAFVISLAWSIVIPAIVTGHTAHVAHLRISWWELIKINLAMRFYVLTLPHAVTVALRWGRYRGGQKNTGWRTATLILFERVVQGAVVVVSAFVFLLLAGDTLPASLRILRPVSGLLSLASGLVLIVFLSRRAFDVVRPVIDRVSGRTPRSIAGRVERLRTAIAEYHTLENRRVAFVLLWSVAGHLLFILSALVISAGLEMDVSFVDLGWMRSTVVLLTVLPITVGGIGVREASFGALLHLYGVDRSRALAFPLLLLAVQLMIGLLGAMLEAFRLFSHRRDEA